MTVSDDSSLITKVVDIYNRLQMVNVFHLPSSSIEVKFHIQVHSKDRGAIHSIKNNHLILDLYAINAEEGIKVAAALLANERLNIARPFGARNGALLYILPIFHLLITLFIVPCGSLILGFMFGIVFGIGAAITIPLLIFWVSTSLETRRSILKENLDATNEFENSLEIDEVVTFLGTKAHSCVYWIKRLFFYESFYISITLLMFFLNSL